ncbi:MAG: shikimate dehydrogenase [Chromatiales bacterium]|jgi:shikimate dehydrogenase
MTDRYAVIGNPIEHSKSPAIHAAFAAQTGQDMAYERILGTDFGDDVHRFVAAGGRGLNVTVPFKEDAWRLVDERGRGAEEAGAVNTIIVRAGGRLRGENTDGIGLVRDLRDNHGLDLAGKQLLVLGAGGAVRGVLGPLLETDPARLVVANRTRSKALELARRFQAAGPIVGCGLDEIAHGAFDLIINGTAAGLGGGMPALSPGCLAPGGWTYDMMYADEPTAFVRWGMAQGAALALDGLGMLVEQAAESFRLWRGIRPETGPVIRSLGRR